MLQDYRTAVCPFIDVVDYNNMEYRAQDEGARGAFDWQLYYKRQVPCVGQERYLYCTSIDIHIPQGMTDHLLNRFVVNVQ
jgi:hypothetical protein